MCDCVAPPPSCTVSCGKGGAECHSNLYTKESKDCAPATAETGKKENNTHREQKNQQREGQQKQAQRDAARKDLRSFKGGSAEHDKTYYNREKHQSYYSSRYHDSSRSDKKKDKSSSNHSPKKIEEDDSILIASCDSSDEDPTCVLGTEAIGNPAKESVGDQSELCPSEKSDSELQDVECTTVSLQSKADVFAFLRNFEVADKSDVAFVKVVKCMFSGALGKYQGKDIEDECFGAEPEPEGSPVERTSRRFRTYSGSRSVSISTQPLNTSDKYTEAKQRKRKICSSSRSSSSDRVQSTSRSSLTITIKSDIVEAKSDDKGLPGDMVNEVENKALTERSTNQPSLADTENTEMDQSVDKDITECLTAEAASSDDEDL